MSTTPPAAAPDPTPGSLPSGGEQTAGRSAAAAAAGSGLDTSSARPAPPPAAAPVAEGGATQRPRKGPLSFLSGALTSVLLAWLSLGLSQKVVAYYAEHPPHYSAQIAQSIATALKTLIVGMCFLATFSFAFIGLGLALTFVRSLIPGRDAEGAS